MTVAAGGRRLVSVLQRQATTGRILLKGSRPRSVRPFSEIKKWAEMKKDQTEKVAEKEASPSPAKDDDDEYENMFVETSVGREWGGPMRGGRFPEPTRFGDWERKGRASDF